VSGTAVELDAFLAARSTALLRTAYALTGDWHRAEDLLQTALVSCYGRWSRIEDPEAYLRRTMVRAYLGWRRRRWVGELPTARVGGGRPDPGEHTAIELRGSVLAALATLPQRQRAVVVLRYYLDLSEAETAGTLGISVGTVKSQSSKGLAKLRDSAPIAALLEEERR
jgi:RNA polymerase sigma-70 factor (sigma-E family)